MKLKTGPLVIGLAAVLVVSVVTACSSSSKTTSGDSVSSAKKSYKIAFGSLNDSETKFKTAGDGIASAAAKYNVKVTRFDNKAIASTALANVRVMIQQKPDLIMEWVSADAAPGVGKLIAQAKIPCIAVNIAVPGCALFNLSNAQIGDAAAPELAKEAKARGWTATDMTVALIEISFAGEEAHNYPTHFYSTFAKQFPDMRQMAPSDITFSTTKIGDFNAVQADSKGTLDSTYTAMQQLLQTIPKDRHIVAVTQNDDSARGALRALQQAGRAKNAIICASGADAGALNALRTDPSWVAESDISQPQWGDLLIPMALAILHGVTPPTLTQSPQRELTKSNIDTYYDGVTRKGTVALPEADSYLKPYILSN